MFRKFSNILAVGMLALFAGLSTAQDFSPTSRPIEIVVPYPPGGATDRWGRIIDDIFKSNGWQSTVVNRPGGDTVIGSNYVAASKPDGHVIYVGGNGFLDANIAFRQKAPGIEYTENSFTPIVPLGAGTLVLAVNNSIPVNTYEEFKQWVKNNPNLFNLGFWNTYTGNLFYEWARIEKLPRPNIVFYKGSAPQVADIVGGHIPFVFDTYTALAPYYKSGKIKIIAVLDRRGPAIIKRDVPLSQVISIASLMPSIDVPVWYGLYAPYGTPQEVINKINQVVNEAVKNPKYSKTIEALHIYNFGGTPEDQRRVQLNVLNIMRNVSKNIE